MVWSPCHIIVSFKSKADFHGLGPLWQLEEIVNATVYNDILDNRVLSSFWQESGEDAVLFHHEWIWTLAVSQALVSDISD